MGIDQFHLRNDTLQMDWLLRVKFRRKGMMSV